MNSTMTSHSEMLAAEQRRIFSHLNYDRIMRHTFDNMIELGTKKGGEYAGDDDRLANFRRNGAALGLPMASVWAVYAAKHWDAIMQYIKDNNTGKTRERMEPIQGRIDDLLTYLILFKCIVMEMESQDQRNEAA